MSLAAASWILLAAQLLVSIGLRAAANHVVLRQTSESLRDGAGLTLLLSGVMFPIAAGLSLGLDGVLAWLGFLLVIGGIGFLILSRLFPDFFDTWVGE